MPPLDLFVGVASRVFPNCEVKTVLKLIHKSNKKLKPFLFKILLQNLAKFSQ